VIYLRRFRLLLVALATLACFTACHHTAGSREFVPGRGWVPN
jgi:hypothetical protein